MATSHIYDHLPTVQEDIAEYATEEYEMVGRVSA
jgi:hypothetical protein